MEGYPRLTAEMIRLAPVYAAAYPLRGPRRKQPWRDQQPVRRGRRRLHATPGRGRGGRPRAGAAGPAGGSTPSRDGDAVTLALYDLPSTPVLAPRQFLNS